MQTVWHSLLWKEWREYRWKLAALSASILIPLFVSITMTRASGMSNFLYAMLVILYCYGILAGFFLGMGAAGKETGAGTAPFLQTLPTPTWKAATAKLLVVSLVTAAPIVLVVLISYLCHRGENDYVLYLALSGREKILASDVPAAMQNWFFHCGVVAVCATLSLLWWVAAFGVNRSDEIRAGAIGFLGVVAAWSGLGFLLYLSDRFHAPGLQKPLAALASAAPGGPSLWQSLEARGVDVPTFDRPWPVAFYIGHALVAACFIFRFGRASLRTGKGENLSSLTPAAGSLRAAFRSQLSAIAWKQMRETGPLAVVALAAAFAMAGVGYWFAEHPETRFSEIFAAVGASITFLVVVVAGIGLYLDDLKPELDYFWRVRPRT